jgi:hypothetical protein
MKIRLFTIVGALALALIVSGCKKEPGTTPTPPPDPDAATLDITYEGTVNNSLTIGNIPAEGGEYTISITSNRDWELIEIDDDILLGMSISPKTGVKGEATPVTITVPANSVGDLPIPDDDGNARSEGLEFRTIPEGDEQPLSRTVTISQLAAPGGDEEEVIRLETARFEYVWKQYGEGTGNSWISFQYKDENGIRSEINLDCVLNFHQDFLQVVPASGTYKFSTGHEKQTFTERSEFVPDVAQYVVNTKVSGGEMTLARDASGKYDISMELTIGSGENARNLKAEYEGGIYPVFFPEVSTDAAGLNTWSEVTVDRFKGSDNMWQIEMKGKSAGNKDIHVRLAINTETGLAVPPTGNFPMAAAPRAGVAGTAEPASMQNYDDYDWGCWYWGDYAAQEHATVDYPDVQYAVPGKGSVNITKEGDLYTFAFTFEGPDGHTVSGSCQKEIETVDPNTISIDFTAAEYSVSGTCYTVTFTWEGAANGEKLSLDMYGNMADVTPIPDHTYSFIDQFDVPWTFSSYGGLTTGTGQDQSTVDPDGGTVTFTNTGGDNYKVDFNIHYNDGRTLKCTYQGEIVEY